jgi:8-oxo-dGTP pyrophosphatase MutT (NUDIX family)
MPKKKVFAYITHSNRLLVFSHPHSPEAGIQVPAGTLNPDEHPETGVLREAFEETGLLNLRLVRFLGEQVREMFDFDRGAIHHRYFYHLQCEGDPPEIWQHEERDPYGGTGEAILFEFFWADLPDRVPELIADHGKFLPELLKHLDGQ